MSAYNTSRQAYRACCRPCAKLHRQLLAGPRALHCAIGGCRGHGATAVQNSTNYPVSLGRKVASSRLPPHILPDKHAWFQHEASWPVGAIHVCGRETLCVLYLSPNNVRKSTAIEKHVGNVFAALQWTGCRRSIPDRGFVFFFTPPRNKIQAHTSP